MTFDFGGVLTRAWQILWKYRILWIFGIFSSCSRGGPNFNWNSSRNDLPQNLPGNNPFTNPSAAQEWMYAHWWVIVLIVLAVILLVLLSVLLGTIGRIGMIRGTLQAEQGAQSLAFNDLFGGSTPYFWRVFGLTFLIGLLFLVIIAPLVIFGFVTAGIGFLCIAPLLCILAIAAIAVGLIVELANVAIVRDNLGIAEGWRRGWDLARTYPGPVIIMAIILGVITFIAGLVVVLPIILIAVPAAIAAAFNQGDFGTPMLIAGLCILAYLPVAIFFNGLVNTFVGSAWTLTYLRLAQPPAAPAEPPTLIEANA